MFTKIGGNVFQKSNQFQEVHVYYSEIIHNIIQRIQHFRKALCTSRHTQNTCKSFLLPLSCEYSSKSFQLNTSVQFYSHDLKAKPKHIYKYASDLLAIRQVLDLLP